MKSFYHSNESFTSQSRPKYGSFTSRLREIRSHLTLLLLILTVFSGNVWADEITVYTTGEIFIGTGDAAWDNDASTISVDLRYGYPECYDCDDFNGYYNAAMTKTAYTYNGYPIYSYTLNKAAAQFRFKHFKNSVWKENYTADWHSTTGQIYRGYINNTHTWVTYGRDITIYAVPESMDGSKWAEGNTLKAVFKYGDQESEKTDKITWTKTDYTYEGNYIYKCTFLVPYNVIKKINFYYNDGTDDEDLYEIAWNDATQYGTNDIDGKIFLGWNKNSSGTHTWVTYGRDITIYTVPETLFSSYDPKFSTSTHTLKCNFKYGDSEWLTPMPEMTKTDWKYHNASIYKVTMLAAFNVVKQMAFQYFNGGSYINEYLYRNNGADFTDVTAADVDGKIYTGYADEAHHWEAYATDITLDQQSGSGGTGSITATVGSAMPAITLPTRTGYTFGGYFTAVDGGGTQYYNSDGSSANNWVKDGPTTLYAKWNAITIATPTVTANTEYIGEDITINLSTTTTYVDESVVIFYVTDGSTSTTYEVVATPGAPGSSPTYSTTHTATFIAKHPATYSVTAKVFRGKLIDNFDGALAHWKALGGGSFVADASNPAIQATNGSSTVMQITCGNEEWNTVQTKKAANDETTTNWNLNYDYIYMSMYSTTARTPKLKYSDDDSGYEVALDANSLTAKTWQRKQFAITHDIDFILPFMPEEGTMYIDDIILSNESSMTAQVTSSAAAVTINQPTLGSCTASAASTAWTGEDINISLSATSTYLADAVVVFFVTDKSTSNTYEVVATPGTPGANNAITHTATFVADRATTYGITAKLYNAKFIDNFEASATLWATTGYGAYEKVANVKREANNGSSTVMKITRNDAEYATAYTTTVEDEGASPTNWGYSYDYIYMRYYAPQAETPKVQYVDGGGVYKNTTLDEVSANTWHHLKFAVDGGTVNRIHPFVCSGDDKFIYVDDIILSNHSTWSPIKNTSGVDITADASDVAITCTIAWVVNGSAYSTGGPSTSGNVYTGIATMPTAPDNSTLSCASSFRGWSTTNVDGEATNTQPTDLFVTASCAPTIDEDKTFYAVFGDASDAVSVGTVLWSENWRGASNNSTPTSPTASGSSKYGDATISYTWANGKDNESEDKNDSKVVSGSLAGGVTPEALIGAKSGKTGIPGYLTVSGIPKGKAKKVTVQYRTNNNKMEVSVTGTGYSGSISEKASGLHSFDVTCGTDETFSLKFEATNSGENVRLDDIVVKIKEDGATNYRTACPELTVTPILVTESTPIFITSSASKTVRSQDSVRIVGHHLTKEGVVSISSPASKFVLKSRTNVNITTDANGDIDTYAYIYYTPTAEDTEDGLDSNASFTISVAGAGAKDCEVSQRLIGRHLPANFIIAAKSGGNWYALPSNMTQGGGDAGRTAAAITVDNNSNPTLALSTTNNIYAIQENGGDGQYVALHMNGKNKPLYGNPDNYQIGSSTKSSNLDADYWWLLTQINTSITRATDAIYRITVSNANIDTLSINDKNKWGLYSADIKDLRLIPWYAEEFEASVANWTDDDMEITTTAAPSTVEATHLALTGAQEAGAVELTDDEATSHVVSFSGANFTDKDGEILVLNWEDEDGNLKAASFITMPNIKVVSSGTYWHSLDPAPTIDDIVVLKKGFYVNRSNAKAMQVVIDTVGANNGRLIINERGGLVVQKNIRVFGGTSFGPTSKNDLQIRTDDGGNGGLICGNASDDTEAEYVHYIKAQKFTYNEHSWYINQYLGIPFAEIEAYKYYGFNIFQYDDGADDWRTPEGTELQPFTCYNFIRKYTDYWNSFYVEGVLNLPGTTDSITTLKCGTRTGTATPSIDETEGHQDYMFANSWTAPISIKALTAADCSGASGADLIHTIYIFNAGFVDPDGNTQKQYGNLAGQWSSYSFSSAAHQDSAVISATQAFMVTATTTNAKLNLDYKKHVYDPAVAEGVDSINTLPTRAPRRIKKATDPVKLKMIIRSDEYVADVLYLFEREDFTPAFDNGWDGYKIMGETFAPQLYAFSGESRLAIDAVPELDETEIGFKAGTDTNAYTFSFEYNDNEPLYLYDKDTQEFTEITNESTYSFTTSDRKEHARFILMRSNVPQSPTGVEEVENETVQRAEKFMKDQQIFIRRGERTYSITGARVR